MKHDHGDCDHWYWGGGTYNLINKNNEIIIENFKPDHSIDFYSLIVSFENIADSTRISFKGTDGRHYSFTDNEKLFGQFISNLAAKPDRTSLINCSYPEIIYWKDGEGWVSGNSSEILDINYHIFVEKLTAMHSPENEYSVVIEDHITCPDTMNSQFDRYRDNCGALNAMKYPYIQIWIGPKGNYTRRDSFGFLKTENGFKLLAVSFGPILK